MFCWVVTIVANVDNVDLRLMRVTVFAIVDIRFLLTTSTLSFKGFFLDLNGYHDAMPKTIT